MSTTKPTGGYDLDRLMRDLCDHLCAAEENGNEELADALNRALDAIELWTGTAAPPRADRGFTD